MMKRATFSAPLCAATLLALVAVSFGEALAQSAVITGKVTGRQGEALGGAIVVIDEFSAAVATTTAGSYTLTVAPERTKGQTVTLRARYIGYSPSVKQITLTPGTQTQDFELKFDPMTLDAVVVTGVAEATEAKKLTFAVGHVDAATLNQAPGVSALGALEGKEAGARLLQSSGAPGGEPAIRLRSAPSLTSPSSCGQALCASTATPGPLIIDDDGNTQTVNNGDFIASDGTLRGIRQGGSVKPDGIADRPYSLYGRPVYDEQSLLLTHGPFYTNYVSIGQRRGNTNFNVSFQNTKQDGVMLLLKGYNRQNFRVNVDQALTPRFDLSVGGFFGKSNNNQVAQGPGAPFFAVTFIEPNIILYAPNADGTPYAALIPHQLPNSANPIYTLANEQINTDRSRFTGYGKATYRLFDWLSLEGNYNYDQETSNFTDVVPKNFLNSRGRPTSGNIVKIDSGGRSFNTGATLTSVRTFRLGGWNVRNTIKAAYVYEDQTARVFADTGIGFLVLNTPEFQAVSRATLSPGSRDITIRNKNYYVVSGFDIKDRYLLDGLVRWDGSSLFGPDSRWQTYYRVSGAYRVTQDVHINGIDELKLRASYGTAGLRPTFDAQYETFAIVGGVPVKQTLGNKALKPARSGEMEIGGNIDFLGRFTLEYSYSRQATNDQNLP